MHCKIICLSIFFTYLIHSFPLVPQKGILLGPHKTQNILYPRITKELFFIKEMIDKKILPTDMTNLILNYTILLGNKDFEEKFPYIQQWHDFCIPLVYNHFLTQEQITIIAKVFEYSIPCRIHCDPQLIIKFGNYYNAHQKSPKYTHYYQLRSKKDYKSFLKLPVKLREYLIQLPLSSQQDLHIFLIDSLYGYICQNPNPIIYVGKYKETLKAKPLLKKPHKKKKFNINR